MAARKKWKYIPYLVFGAVPSIFLMRSVNTKLIMHTHCPPHQNIVHHQQHSYLSSYGCHIQSNCRHVLTTMFAAGCSAGIRGTQFSGIGRGRGGARLQEDCRGWRQGSFLKVEPLGTIANLTRRRWRRMARRALLQKTSSQKSTSASSKRLY